MPETLWKEPNVHTIGYAFSPADIGSPCSFSRRVMTNPPYPSDPDQNLTDPSNYSDAAPDESLQVHQLC